MLDWADLQAKVRGEPVLLHRTAAVQAAYESERVRLGGLYARYSDHIKIKYMRWKGVCGSGDGSGSCNDDKRLVAVRTRGSLTTCMTHNEYPYDLAPGIEHFVLWSTKPPPTPAAIQKLARRFLRTRGLLDQRQFIARVNSDAERSIKDLWHCHVFVVAAATVAAASLR